MYIYVHVCTCREILNISFSLFFTVFRCKNFIIRYFSCLKIRKIPLFEKKLKYFYDMLLRILKLTRAGQH